MVFQDTTITNLNVNLEQSYPSCFILFADQGNLN